MWSADKPATNTCHNDYMYMVSAREQNTGHNTVILFPLVIGNWIPLPTLIPFHYLNNDTVKEFDWNSVQTVWNFFRSSDNLILSMNTTEDCNLHQGFLWMSRATNQPYSKYSECYVMKKLMIYNYSCTLSLLWWILVLKHRRRFPAIIYIDRHKSGAQVAISIWEEKTSSYNQKS